MFSRDVQLTDIISREDWQDIQDSLSDALGITLRAFSPDGSSFSGTSHPLRLCAEILPKVCAYIDPSLNCLLESTTKNLKEINRLTRIKCHFGLDTFAIPIRAAGNKTVAYLLFGPIILQARKTVSEYAEEAKKLNVKLEDIADELITVKVFSYNKADSIASMLENVFSHIVQAGYHKKRLGEIRPEVIGLDPLFSKYYEEKILNSLLSSCTLALNADSGSVMTLDHDTNMLHIKAASKLDKDIVDNTNLKLGEGIAGLAAATSESIILPNDKRKKSLKEKMKRQYIKSSMIVPFKKADNDDVYGVINLNVVRKRVKFSERDIELVKNLVNMVSIALVPLRQTDT